MQTTSPDRWRAEYAYTLLLDEHTQIRMEETIEMGGGGGGGILQEPPRHKASQCNTCNLPIIRTSLLKKIPIIAGFSPEAVLKIPHQRKIYILRGYLSLF